MRGGDAACGCLWWWQEHALSIESCGLCSPRCDIGLHTRALCVGGSHVRPSISHAQGSLRDTHVTTTVHSYDDVHDPTALSVNAASCALALSSAPWHGPAGCVRVALIGGEEVLAYAKAWVRALTSAPGGAGTETSSSCHRTKVNSSCRSSTFSMRRTNDGHSWSRRLPVSCQRAA